MEARARATRCQPLRGPANTAKTTEERDAPRIELHARQTTMDTLKGRHGLTNVASRANSRTPIRSSRLRLRTTTSSDTSLASARTAHVVLMNSRTGFLRRRCDPGRTGNANASGSSLSAKRSLSDVTALRSWRVSVSLTRTLAASGSAAAPSLPSVVERAVDSRRFGGFAAACAGRRPAAAWRRACRGRSGR